MKLIINNDEIKNLKSQNQKYYIPNIVTLFSIVASHSCTATILFGDVITTILPYLSDSSGNELSDE